MCMCRVVAVNRGSWTPEDLLDQPPRYAVDQVLLARLEPLIACRAAVKFNMAQERKLDTMWAVVESIHVR
jgi:hypothetical protein